MKECVFFVPYVYERRVKTWNDPSDFSKIYVTNSKVSPATVLM
jgi:hypothetical protein